LFFDDGLFNFCVMTDNTPPKNPSDLPPGFTDLSGPAAFKAQQAAEEALAAAESDEVTEADEDSARKIRELEEAFTHTKDQLLRTVAEMENLRKRSAREREDASKYAVSSFAKDLLEVADNFRRALDHLPPEWREDEKSNAVIEGIEATERAMLKVFEKNGIQKIEPKDEPFNPNLHEVMFEAAVPGKPSGMIIQLIEAGYTLNDRLLRPARVGVAKGEPGGETPHNVDTSA